MLNDPKNPTPAGPLDKELYAIAAEFTDVDALMGAAEKLRDAGFLKWDVHSPFPIHGMDKAMGVRPTILPWIALVHGLIGMGLGLLLVWWTNATTVAGVPTELQGYQYIISGKPIFSLPANIPIIFELAILFAAFGTVLGTAHLATGMFRMRSRVVETNFRRFEMSSSRSSLRSWVDGARRRPRFSTAS